MIKLFEQYNEYTQVKDWLDKMGIENYTINDDLTVDVDGSVNICDMVLYEIPIQFGKIYGNFECAANKLTNLKGCPVYVEGCFSCSDNRLTTLLYFPKYIGEYIYYGMNSTLPSEVYILDNISLVVKYQDEYGIWNQDGSLNQGRWNILEKDYYDGLLTI